MIEPLRPLPPPLPGLTLVLGAGGFLGSHAARWLARQGAALRLFDLSVDSIPQETRTARNVEIVQGSLLDENLVRRSLANVDQVLHFVSATVPATSVADVALELRANVEPLVTLLGAMRAEGTPLLVFPSSGGTLYGDEPAASGFPESAAPRPANSYGLGKLLCEEILGFSARSGGPHALVLRIANAYGPSVHAHRRNGAIHAFLECVRAGDPVRIWGDGSVVRDFVHAEDVLAALSALVHSGVRDDIVNVGSGEGVSLSEILKKIETVTGRRIELERVDGEYPGVARNVLDISRIRERTGWSPSIDLTDGIAHVWRSLAES